MAHLSSDPDTTISPRLLAWASGVTRTVEGTVEGTDEELAEHIGEQTWADDYGVVDGADFPFEERLAAVRWSVAAWFEHPAAVSAR